MPLEQSLERIRIHLLRKYGINLAGALVLGSANTGHYSEGVSDINGMVFVSDGEGMDFGNEEKDLMQCLRDVNFQTQYVNSLQGIQDYIRSRHSFATFMVISADDGSITLHSTSNFEDVREELRRNPLTDEQIKANLREKRKSELEGYFLREGRSGEKYGDRPYRETQNLLFSVRRSLQAMNFLKTRSLVFDFNRCLESSELSVEDRARARELYDAYANRRVLSPIETRSCYALAGQLIDKISGGAR